MGRNQHPLIGEWEVQCTVDVFEPAAAFGWCTNTPDYPAARWRFEVERFPGHCRLRFRAVFGPAPSGLSVAIANRPDMEPKIISRRMHEHRANMQRVLRGVKNRLAA